MSISGDAIWTGIVALTGTGIGAVVSYVASKQAWKRSETITIIDEIAQLHDVVWNVVKYRDANVLMTKLRFKLAHLGVEQPLIDELINTAWACRVEYMESEILARGDEDEEFVGLPNRLLDPFNSAQAAVARALRR
ncbi:MAG: hypothetical protein JWN99_1053 [Ilumatobacteraceae bacterium]|nr:hypothetical protein [Ilumatobacteraceae bacterium]